MAKIAATKNVKLVISKVLADKRQAIKQKDL